MSIRSESALESFGNTFNCAQSSFGAFCQELGLDQELGFKIACGFGGGMGHTNESCGAVTGAVMAIGLKYGKAKSEDTTSKEKTYQLVSEFAARFRKEFGSLRCTELVGYDLSCPEQVAEARQNGAFKAKCPVYIKRAVEIAEELLSDE